LGPEKAFGEVLRHLRRERGLSQEALALEAGAERNYISLLELGKSSASMRMLFKLCSVLGLPPSRFLEQVEGRMKDRGVRKRPSR
jgi:transcriptional regulator with XRE-family HTH domain